MSPEPDACSSGSGLQANAVETRDALNTTVALNFPPIWASGQVNALRTFPVTMNLQSGVCYWIFIAPLTNGIPDLDVAETAFPAGYPNNFDATWVNPDTGFGLATKCNLT